ncbi:serine/threonine protein kinase/beta-lactam-binding protein with PASTA domain [Streptosporangium album]|uniref:non-specific serine/threonine protein kinase n=1 Tax=Streptosporangium album TaxID=47479 RepID=A0A7W7WAI9_9ACTN|nr:PASTA domain-containing protein [Streptosporangium album]MBB4940482.1 serine/threonine protein kinase/beta-lactam-binding protein with PASTA domain [Streptosporangium album]
MPHAQPLRTGDLEKLGEYAIMGRLGEGGQGVVYLGVHPETGSESYAIKLLHGPLGEDEAVFLREVELAKQVARFCTAQVIDAGLAGDRPYIVSEYIDGPSLHREVADTGPRGGGALERLAIGTATALAAIHRAGIVHRDFKPQNVLLGPDGPRVIDFGLARALEAGATQSGRGAGTPAYMAPEQVEGTEIRPAADVFSWGATICFAANAHAPFGQDSVAAVFHRILSAPPELGHLDGQLGALVADCLEKDPRNRPTSRELLLSLLGDDVRPAAARSPSVRVPVAFGSPPAPAASPSRGPRGASGEFAEPRTRPGRAATRASVAVSGALLVSAAVLVGVLVPALTGSDDQAGRSEPRNPPGTSGTRVELTPQQAGVARPAAPVPNAGTTVASPPAPSDSPAPPASPAPSTPPEVPVPVLAGLDRSEALRLIKQAGLVAGTLTRADSDLRIGQVLSTVPVAGTAVAKGTKVDLQVSAGVPVPALAGLGRKQAEAALTQARLALGEVTMRCSAEPGGRVLTSAPAAGEHVSSGSAVTLVVSKRGAEVPSVVGRKEADARSALSEAGFAVRVRPRLVSDPAQSGVVLAQSGASGPCARPDAVVVITVGVEGQTGPGPDPDPDPGETSAPADSTGSEVPGSAGESG